MKKFNAFKILFYYLKDEKLKLFMYILLVLFTYLPGLATAYFLGIALEALIELNLNKFLINLAI